MNPSVHPIKAEGLELGRRLQVPLLVVEQAQCLVICGPNGSGKSTLLRCLAGLEPAHHGRIEIAGQAISALSRRALSSRIAWLPQRPELSEAVRCSSLVAQARFRFGESSARAHDAACRFLEAHQISHLSEQLTSRVSGGELQRVLIAALDAQECPILLVDEPANHLDPQHQVATYQRLGRLWQQKNKTLVIVSHDLRLARLLGPAAQVRVLGIKNSQIIADLSLDAPDLHLHLQQIYGVPFVPLDQAGGLSVLLEPSTHSDLTEPPKGDS